MTETNRKLIQREHGEQGTIDLQEKEKQDAMDTKIIKNMQTCEK